LFWLVPLIVALGMAVIGVVVTFKSKVTHNPTLLTGDNLRDSSA